MTTADVLAAPCVPEPYVMIKNANDVNKLVWKIIFFMEKTRENLLSYVVTSERNMFLNLRFNRNKMLTAIIEM